MYSAILPNTQVSSVPAAENGVDALHDIITAG